MDMFRNPIEDELSDGPPDDLDLAEEWIKSAEAHLADADTSTNEDAHLASPQF